MELFRVLRMRGVTNMILGCVLAVLPLIAQTSSSSSSTGSPAAGQHTSSSSPRPVHAADATGAALTLETSEPLFDIATALNACGYDTDLANSSPIRAQVRADVASAVAASVPAQTAQAALCQYITEHALTSKARELAQYVSLALFTGPAPELKPLADETDMPPDALAVVNMLPLLRTFADAVDLHAIWLGHHAQYEALINAEHDPITRMILSTNVYLKVPVSSYDGRRVIILLEPMLAPDEPNGRIYASDYVLVTSPNASGAIKMDQIRHLYLQYEIDPLVYAKSTSMQRLQPLLKPVASAPLEYVFRTDVVALVTECLIKAIEARTMDTGYTPPVKPTGTRARADLARYDEELSSYDRLSEVVRRRQVELDMREGWVLTDYFYNQLIPFEHTGDALSQEMGPLVYGMDVGREVHQASQIQFLPQSPDEFVRRVPRPPNGLMLGEKDLLEGRVDAAEAIADKALADPAADHGDALYLKARIDLTESDPKSATDEFRQILTVSHNPHTLAWAHIYLGRLYDIKEPTERDNAVREYHAALAVPQVAPDAKAAAERGLATPFTVPRTVHTEEEPVDPTGKKEKESYKPE
jgi:tetratricopeptide (TPR) repeat protein